eukprot:TRINITY_DN11219_c0_g1_i1.p1 TRINITY_DN11219_c0_g1~~TRINITY_DN11219_c0_g1_i1.p1  ORF type:complete len:880 (+),score=134.03 TRINITY_DN11219_c0_g1_i1:34-2640(+)
MGNGLGLRCSEPAVETSAAVTQGYCDYPDAQDASQVALISAQNAGLSGLRKRRTMGRCNSLTFTRGAQELSIRPPSEKTPEEKQMLTTSIRSNPKLQRLANFSEEHIDLLVSTAHKEVFEAGEYIMTEGDLDNKTFYVTASGEFEVSSSEPFKVVYRDDGHADLAPSEAPPEWLQSESQTRAAQPKATQTIGKMVCLGVSTMMNCTPRKTTIRALGRCVLWVFCEASVKIVAEQAQEASSASKSPEEMRLVSEVLEANGNLQGLIPLRSRHFETLARVAFKREVDEGNVIMREGDLNADGFYIVGEGLLEFTSSEPFQVVESRGMFHLARGEGSAKTTRECGVGLSFGELSMLGCTPRFATVTAKKKTVLWEISRSDFQATQQQAVEEHVKGRAKTLEQLSSLSSFSAKDKERFAGVLKKTIFREGEFIYTEDDTGTALYIVYEGSVAISARGKPDDVFVAKPSAGTYDYRYFGEAALLDDVPQPRMETVRVTSSKVSALVLEQEDMSKIWERLIAEPPSAFERYQTGVARTKNDEETALSWENLETLGLLGCGALGPVDLVKHKKTKELYALKRMSKGLIVQRGLRQGVVQERTLWMEVLSPFVVKVFATLHDAQTLCYLLEPALGGSLALYAQHSLHGKPEIVKYHTAGVVLALEHLHKRNILYRNIKPENIVLSHEGQPKLTDMSLAKIVYGHTFTTCGTPNYMSPEVISGVGHTQAADWWSLGILIFELMAGHAPFDAEQPMSTFSGVMRGINSITMPSVCDSAVESLIRDLLKSDSIDRLAMRPGGVQNILDHAWFASFDWAAMRSLSLKPPYMPSFSRDLSLNDLPTSALLAHASARSTNLPRPVELFCDEDGSWEEEFTCA